MEAITFPDVEAVVVGHLSTALTARADTATVSTMIPSPRPARLVKVTRTGGVRVSVGHELAQVTVDCWDASTATTAALTGVVRGLLSALHVVDTGIVARFVREVGGPAFLPDPLTGLPRYRMTVQIVQKSQTL